MPHHVQAEELRGELGEVRAELKEAALDAEELEQELETAQTQLRKAEVEQDERQQRCLSCSF